jgi:hypothetical protein
MSAVLTQIPAGAHSITAGYYGDNSFSNSVNLTPVNFTITKDSTTTALNAQQTAQSLLLTAAVTASSSGATPTGPVTFTSGNTVLGTVYLSNGSNSSSVVQATATLDASQLAAGQYNVSAKYPGDTNYSPSTSASVPLNLTADFTVADRGITSQTVSAGGTASYINDLAVTSFFGYSGTVTVSCDVPAKGTTCTLNPSSYAVDSTTLQGIGTISVTTTSRVLSSAMTRGKLNHHGLWAEATFAFSLFGFVVLSSQKRRRSSANAARLSFILLVALGSASCGGGSAGNSGGGGGPKPNPNGTPVGVYVLTVTGTSGSASHTTNLTLTVQ